MADLDQPDPEIDRLWVAEANHRWEAIQKGAPTSSMKETFGKYRSYICIAAPVTGKVGSFNAET